MAREAGRLSEQSADVLWLISAGKTYEQILEMRPELDLEAIYEAAAEAIALHASQRRPLSEYDARLAEIKAQSPRAYATWTREEETRLLDLFDEGRQITEIAQQLERQPSAIRSRLLRLGRIGPVSIDL